MSGRTLLCPRYIKRWRTGKWPSPGIPTIRGKWWSIFDDPQLNDLEEQVNISNQTVLAAEAQYRQAMALVQAAQAAYFPTRHSRRLLHADLSSSTLTQSAAAGGTAHFGLSLARQRVLGGRRVGAHSSHCRGQPGRRPGERRRPRISPVERSGCTGADLFSVANSRCTDAASRCDS